MKKGKLLDATALGSLIAVGLAFALAAPAMAQEAPPADSPVEPTPTPTDAAITTARPLAIQGLTAELRGPCAPSGPAPFR